MAEKYLPVIDATTQSYWNAAREGVLLIQRNPVSGQYQWYPRTHCLDDPRQAPEWIAASGRGTVFTYSVIFRGGVEKTPYICALIELEEGIRFLSRIESVSPDAVAIGMPVVVQFRPTDDPNIALPVFIPQSAT